MKHIAYTYKQYKGDINSLSKQVKASEKKYDLILGLERGGLVPAVHLSHKLGLPLKTLKWSSVYKDVSMMTYFLLRNKKILLVDDIIDSGKTFHGVYERFWNMDSACLIYNSINEANINPKYYGRKINRNEIPEYFDFWWEQ